MNNSRLLVAIYVCVFSSSFMMIDGVLAKDEDNIGDEGIIGVLNNPLAKKRAELRLQALEQQLTDNTENKDKTAKVNGQYVELEREGENAIWTVLAEFGDTISPIFGGDPGPQHNEIPEPDRSLDNVTVWSSDFNPDYYNSLLFSEIAGAASMRNYFIEQSSNRYAVNGDIADWVQVPYNTAHYGTGAAPGLLVWEFVRDSVDAWYAAALSDGMTSAEINNYLSQFDVWDRDDYDGDGNFDEPDGYIDHFQLIHAGVGNEFGGGSYGDQAIWSHYWYVNHNTTDGPAFNMQGGVQIGSSDYWVGDYTILPENGGVGDFTYFHCLDLGLPSLQGGSGNSAGFWSAMATGSFHTDGTTGLGTRPGHLGAWEKFQLGWLNYEVAFAGQKSSHKLGPAETNTKQAQGLFVVLPQKEVITELGAPYAGSYFYYSGKGDNLDNRMIRQFSLPAASSLTAQVRYDIETDWDYAYLIISTDGGTSWNAVETNLSSATSPNGLNLGNGITGTTSDAWVVLTADLSSYAGNVLLGFRYVTDDSFSNTGFMVDEITVTGSSTDGAETDTGWVKEGFIVATATLSNFYNHYYLAEYRQYYGFDDTLQTAYNYGFLDNPALSNWVEFFPYQEGLLINYWDTSQSDNNTFQHPGQGMILPIDAHPDAMYRADGGVWRSRVQAYDSTFGLDPTDAITLHWLSEPSYHNSQPPVSVFNDNNQYYNPATPNAGVINPHTGTIIQVKDINESGTFMQVQVRPVK